MKYLFSCTELDHSNIKENFDISFFKKAYFQMNKNLFSIIKSIEWLDWSYNDKEYHHHHQAKRRIFNETAMDRLNLFCFFLNIVRKQVKYFLFTDLNGWIWEKMWLWFNNYVFNNLNDWYFEKNSESICWNTSILVKHCMTFSVISLFSYFKFCLYFEIWVLSWWIPDLSF
jgi:hypothetical protein